jgi:hypothetical protein
MEIRNDIKAGILKNAIGPSGNLRALTFQIRANFIRFNLEHYDEKTK